MLRHADIIKWRSEKAERGRAVAALSYAHNRVGLINVYQQEKRNVKDTIKTYSGMGWHLRDTIFDFYNKIDVDIRIINSFKRCHDAKNGLSFEDQKLYDKWKDGAKRRVIAARSIRFQVGNPPLLTDQAYPFWVDPTSKYIPEDQYEAAVKHGIVFHTITYNIHHGVATRLLNRTEGRRGHCGLWTAFHDEANENPDSKAKQPYIFAFESFTDLIEFRFRYEFEEIRP